MDENPYQSPQAEDGGNSGPELPAGCEHASITARLSALFVDAFLCYVLCGLIVVPLGWLVSEEISPGFSLLPNWFIFLLIPLLCCLSLVNYSLLNARSIAERGQTVGMRWRRIKFVRKDGSPVTVGRILWRRTAILWPLYFVPGFNALAALYAFGLALRKSRYSLHDDVADTMVVKA